MKQAQPKPWVFPGAYALLAVILFAGAYLAGSWHAPDRVEHVRTEQVEAKLESADDVRASLGVEPQPVDCAQLNIPAELRCEAFEDAEKTVILVTAP